jgi:hypothetical protein
MFIFFLVFIAFFTALVIFLGLGFFTITSIV